MAYKVTQKDLEIIRQSKQEIFLKVELCNKDYKVLDSLEGNVISDNYSQTNSSSQRRLYTCELVVTDSTFTIGSDRKIWGDKRLRVYYGIKSLREQSILWYLIGTFVYVNMNYNFSQTTASLSLSCIDLMAEYDGTINGEFGGYGSSKATKNTAQGFKIVAGENIRHAIIVTLEHAGISRYIVEDIKKEIPYDLEFQTGVTYADIWKSICALYDSWEYFFDTDGTFIWRKISTCLEEPVILNHDSISDLIISEQLTASFSGIYNVTEVWGKVLDLQDNDRYIDSSTYSENVYRVNSAHYTSWDNVDNLTKFAFPIAATNQKAPCFSVNGYSSIPIYDGNGVPLSAGMLVANTVYVFRYRRTGVSNSGVSAALYLLGQFQCYGKYVENSAHCPFSVVNLGYEIKRSLDYETLSDDAACYNQAEYLTYTTTAMMDTITLNLLVIPWLEVNSKIEYRPYSNNPDKKTFQYVIQKIDWNTGNGSMSLTLYKFVESFSYVLKKKGV